MERSARVTKTDNPSAAQPAGPLVGLRVLDFSRILAGPTCTQLLGDMGADVIKVERPGLGDDTRAWGPPYVQGPDGPTSESAYYLSANRNKRSVAMDIATPEGQALALNIAKVSDVFIQNFKTGDIDRRGLGYEAVRAVNPDIIYCSISGYGQTGPNKDKPGYDLMAQGYGGVMSLTGDPGGVPTKVGVGIADVMCGMYATVAILAALRHRDQGGGGQHIDLALVDSQIAWLINEGTNHLLSGKLPVRRGNEHPNIVPYGVFPCADGHVIAAVGNDAQFARFTDLLGVPLLAEDPAFATNQARIVNRKALVPQLEALTAKWDKAALSAAMEARKVPVGPIHDVAEVFASDQVAARGLKVSVPHPGAASGAVDLIGNPMNFSATPVAYRRHPPMCGEHTEEVLRELGLWTGA
ncbi:MAG: crotonobetainyl-CoA:carnitine CoA-transferase CaiB-like acyl-CoA transferase [Paracoccaceae bacterium]|jgi:crotonobetainyl-CoA:carnitine CoA-transferase CaiB-like acyl-CoA transferase